MKYRRQQRVTKVTDTAGRIYLEKNTYKCRYNFEFVICFPVGDTNYALTVSFNRSSFVKLLGPF